MGRLIKNHLARLIVLTASVYQVGATIEAFIWPKIFWDFLTKNLDGAVKPVPYLQIVSLILALFMFAFEWPLPLFAGTALHRSIEFRLVLIPLVSLIAILLYQTTNPAIYLLVGEIFYFWAFAEGESIPKEPWKVDRARREPARAPPPLVLQKAEFAV